MLQWLVEKSDCMFVGLRDTIYVCGVTSEDMVYSIDTNIHHVEYWGSLSENAKNDGESLAPDGDVKNTEYYKRVVGYGKQCQNDINWKFEHTLHFPDLGEWRCLYISCLCYNEELTYIWRIFSN